MLNERVVITGLGVICSNGIGKDAFGNALFNGLSGIKPVSLFDVSGFKAKTAGEITGFKPEEILGPKGLRTLDRSTKLVCSAAKIALQDAGLEMNEENSAYAGVAIGTTLGSLRSISDFDKEAITEGAYYVNPALFPNTVINSPASQVAIKLNIKGFNATISTGFTAGMDALSYAVDFIRLGRAQFVLAGGVEELCIQTYLGFYRAGCLAGTSENAPEICCPFDRRRNGTVLAEGSAVLVLEELSSALERKAKIYAEILGTGTAFDALYINKYNPEASGLKRAMRLAIDEAGIMPEKIGYICSGANSSQEADLMEVTAIKEVFAEDPQKPAVSAIKSMIGECFSASASLQAAAALLAIEKQTIPATINYQEKDPRCDLNIVVNNSIDQRVDNILINSFGPAGSNSCMVLSKYKG